mgnify:CR=1 FL=1
MPNRVNISSKPPTLEEALIELFQNGGAPPNIAKEIYDNLLLMCKEIVNRNWASIKEENKDISKNDALIISSYTYEAKEEYKHYSPYILLNKNLVENDRKEGITKILKYLFLLLRALRRMNICKKQNLFRCITTKVKLEKDQNNEAYVPYEIGKEKIFWPFISTLEDESEAENFLGNNGTGTKYKIKGDDLWGYDISKFNVDEETIILLEPERKYVIEEIKNGDIIEVTCKILNESKVLGIYDKIYKPVVSIILLI